MIDSMAVGHCGAFYRILGCSSHREGLMAMKIATRINSIEGGSKLRGRLRGRLPGGFEAGLQSLEAMQIAEKTPMFRRMKQGSRQACTQRNICFSA